MIHGLITIQNKYNINSLSNNNTTTTTTTQHQSVTLIIDSIITSIVALLGLWAGVKEIFALLIMYGIILVISIVLSITIGLGIEQVELDSDVGDDLIGIFLIIIGIVLALCAFRLACLTKNGVDRVETDSEPQEEQNQCEIV